MWGLTLYHAPRQNSLFRPTDKIYFACKLKIVKYLKEILEALQADKNNNFFTFKLIYTYDLMELNYFYNKDIYGLFCRIVPNTYISCSVTFTEAGTCGDIMRNILYRQTVERLHYTRNVSDSFTVMGN